MASRVNPLACRTSNHHCRPRTGAGVPKRKGKLQESISRHREQVRKF